MPDLPTSCHKGVATPPLMFLRVLRKPKKNANVLKTGGRVLMLMPVLFLSGAKK
jgi:hypothetical protein